MKQGTKRKLAPKPKHEKKSWQRRNEARAAKQDRYNRAQQARENGETLLATAIEQEAA